MAMHDVFVVTVHKEQVNTNWENRSKEKIQQKIVAHTIIMTVQVISLASLRANTSF